MNEGNAMDLTTGIFTAPRPGIYFFSFTALAGFPASSSYASFSSFLYLNGNLIGSSYIKEYNPVNHYSPLTLQSTLNLKKGDQVWVQISPGYSHMFDNSFHYTHFTGFMLEEEIVASL
jgi:hypothetical protein